MTNSCGVYTKLLSAACCLLRWENVTDEVGADKMFAEKEVGKGEIVLSIIEYHAH